MLKQNQLNNSSKKITNTEENFPNLSPFIIPKKIKEKKFQKDQKKINYFCLFNTLKSESIKKPLFNQITQRSKKIIIFPSNKSDNKSIKIYRNNNELRNRVINNHYYRSLKRQSFDNCINGKKLINEKNESSSKRIINLYENTFKDIVLNSKEKNKISPNKKKRKSVMMGYNIRNKNINVSINKKQFQLPPIFNFHNSELRNSHTNNKICSNIFKYDFIHVNNRYTKIKCE